jgi:hypothetical protein
VTHAAFNGNGSYSFDLTANASLASFLTAAGSDALSFSVVSSLKVGTTLDEFFTASSAVTNTTRLGLNSANTAVGGFQTGANGVSDPTANSANLSASVGWGTPGNEGSFENKLGNITDNAAPGTALAFYQEGAVGQLNGTGPTDTLTTFASTWNYVAGILTYGPQGGGSVPLPAPLLLLLSGLGLMGVVARRKSARDDVGGALAA